MNKKQQPKHRRCTKCREIKPVEEFYLYWHSKQNTQYFTAHCKVCTRMERRQAYHRRKARKAIIDKEPIDRGKIHRSARERILPQEKIKQLEQRQPKHNTDLGPSIRAWMISLIEGREKEL